MVLNIFTSTSNICLVQTPEDNQSSLQSICHQNTAVNKNRDNSVSEFGAEPIRRQSRVAYKAFVILILPLQQK